MQARETDYFRELGRSAAAYGYDTPGPQFWGVVPPVHHSRRTTW